MIVHVSYQMQKKPTLDLIHISMWNNKLQHIPEMLLTDKKKIHCCKSAHNYHELLETNVYIKVSSAVTAITPRQIDLPITCK